MAKREKLSLNDILEILRTRLYSADCNIDLDGEAKETRDGCVKFDELPDNGLLLHMKNGKKIRVSFQAE